MTDQHILTFMLVMDPELIDQGGACFVQTLHFYLRAESTELEHHLIRSVACGNVPETRMGVVDLHFRQGFRVVE
jgi:hypothetical protein